jgi:hypothetical protein
MLEAVIGEALEDSPQSCIQTGIDNFAILFASLNDQLGALQARLDTQEKTLAQMAQVSTVHPPSLSIIQDPFQSLTSGITWLMANIETFRSLCWKLFH